MIRRSAAKPRVRLGLPRCDVETLCRYTGMDSRRARRVLAGKGCLRHVEVIALQDAGVAFELLPDDDAAKLCAWLDSISDSLPAFARKTGLSFWQVTRWRSQGIYPSPVSRAKIKGAYPDAPV